MSEEPHAEAPDPKHSAPARRRLLVALLRLAGAVELFAFVAVVMPRSWMDAGHEWLGMGAMPTGAVVDFMIRQASFTYGAHGILLWLLASDPERYRPLVLFTGIAYLVGGPVFGVIEVTSGMPWFWTVGDAGGCFAFGAAVLWLARRPRHERSVAR